MLRVKPEYFEPVESRISRLLWDNYFSPIFAILKSSGVKLNSGENAILSAIRSGQIQYKNGVFFGQFNVRISQQLSKFAIFDSRSKTWRGEASAAIKGAAIIAASHRSDLIQRLDYAISEAESNVADAIRGLSLGDDLPLPLMSADIGADLYSVGVMPEITPHLEKKLRKDYTESQDLNIKNWIPEQTERLREMVQRIQTTSDNSSIRELIQSEWNTSAAKAKFLARQETSLFFSKLSLNRASASGVRRYRWSTSNDARVRDEQTKKHWYNHRHLQGQIIAIDSDGGVVDLKTGRKAHAGEDYNCRCAKIWILD